MATKKITDLQLISSIVDGVNFVVDNGIQTYRATASQLKTYILAAGNVGTTALANLAVTAAKLAADAVETDKIVNLAVTEGKLATAVQNRLGGNLLARYVYTSSDTYTKNASAKYLRVIVIGAGGSGGGAAATGAGTNSESGAGGAGGYSEKIIQNTSIGSTETVTVGAGGAAATAGNNNGNAGGTSSFGAHCSSTGGAAGQGSAATSGNVTNSGGAGGSGSGGDINIPGGRGHPGRVVDSNLSGHPTGGNSAWSGIAAIDTFNTTGTAGKFPGGGSSGVANGASQSARASEAGAGGLVIVEEYA